MSGLGDRLIDIFMLAGLARVRGDKIYVKWPPFTAKAIDTHHRTTDILLENVLKFISLPSEIVFDADTPTQDSFDNYLGGGGEISSFYNAYVAGSCSIDEFHSVLRSVAKDFVFCEALRSYLETIPPKFVTLHVRRGDKVRNEAHDGTYIHANELDWLNQMTYKALDYFVAQGYDTFFVCGDEDEKKMPFVNYVRESKGKTVFNLPDMPKWQATYYDLAVMTRSDFNVASQRYSAFSRFPCLLGNGRFTTVFGLNSQGLI